MRKWIFYLAVADEQIACISTFQAPVAQLDRVTGFERGGHPSVGREFESLRARQLTNISMYRHLKNYSQCGNLSSYRSITLESNPSAITTFPPFESLFIRASRSGAYSAEL